MTHHQSQIPEGGNPLCFILYADKTKLSSFGTTKGYPVVARCANLPAAIRNGNGFGGRRVVGWLPIVMSQIPYLLSFSDLFLRSPRIRKNKRNEISSISSVLSGISRSVL